jgi:archaellum component FlaG (FlaF/FlaG flagellin family)
MKKIPVQFVVCVKNKGYGASLELSKLYEVVVDGSAQRVNTIRVIDESGEDYLYPKDYFVPVQVPQSAERIVRRIAYSNRS